MTDDDGSNSNMDIDTPAESKTPPTEPKKDANANPSASAEDASKDPDMELAQSIHRLLLPAEVAEELGIKEDPVPVLNKIVDDLKNPSLYRRLAGPLGWDRLSEDDLATMEEERKSKTAELEAAVESAKESAGDMEVSAARREVARFAARSSDKEEALAAYDALLALPKTSVGKRMEALMERSRVAGFHDDEKATADSLERATKLGDDGGDWDRRNRLKVYRALHLIGRRDVAEAASLLLDCVATFACNELCSYPDFVVYTVLTNLLHLPRTELKKGVVDRPEILSLVGEAAGDDPHRGVEVVTRLAASLHDCDYRGYLQAVVDLQPVLDGDRILRPHAGYLLRELHVKGYGQFLDSYRSVTLASMANAFGVSTQWLDAQLARFIAAGRLSARIDSFGGVVETNRPDEKNARYRDMIKKGDALLNRIQKLTRVVDL